MYMQKRFPPSLWMMHFEHFFMNIFKVTRKKQFCVHPVRLNNEVVASIWHFKVVRLVKSINQSQLYVYWLWHKHKFVRPIKIGVLPLVNSSRNMTWQSEEANILVFSSQPSKPNPHNSYRFCRHYCCFNIF
jgi:hypothetical protein